MSDRLTVNHYEMFGQFLSNKNSLIGILSGSRLDFAVTAETMVPNFATFSLDPAKWLPLYRYTSAGERIDNVTEWGLQQFLEHYKGKRDLNSQATITKEDIFHYTYAVLHNPAYRKKYELNLKREFPRIPFYENFFQWRDWGKQLMDLHINYETVAPYPLLRLTTEYEARNMDVWESFKKAKLKADKEKGSIILDGFDELQGIPKEAWAYKLGNRSALEWILDQYKEKKPKDPSIAEKFNTYKFADYKEKVIDLLKRVCTVSVETMKVVGEME